MIVILGAGYTGRFLYARAAEHGLETRVTSRSPDTHLTFAPVEHRLEFDLQREATWPQIPPGADLVWCFPATPLATISAFASAVLRTAGRLVVLGSTSAYRVADTEHMIDESAPLDSSRPRVIGEEYLRTEYQAVILRVAGIYGPGRHVLGWIRRGKVGRSQRWVNLIHVDDLAAICLLALASGRRGDVYNVSDGRPRRWAEICDEAHARWGIMPTPGETDRGLGKQISIEKLTRDFHYRFRHPDLYRALEEIEAATSAQVNASPKC